MVVVLLILLALPMVQADTTTNELEDRYIGCLGQFSIRGEGDYTATRGRLDFDINGECTFNFKIHYPNIDTNPTSCRGTLILPIYTARFTNVDDVHIIKGYCLCAYIQSTQYDIR